MNTHSNNPSPDGRGLQLAIASIVRGLDDNQIRFNYDLATATEAVSARQQRPVLPANDGQPIVWDPTPRRRSSTRLRAVR